MILIIVLNQTNSYLCGCLPLVLGFVERPLVAPRAVGGAFRHPHEAKEAESSKRADQRKFAELGGLHLLQSCVRAKVWN